MKVDVLLGLQWGDEGKGKVVDVLTPKYNFITRFQGGPNAGHTLEFNEIKHVLHTIPSGIFRDDKINVIGNGVVIDPVIFKKEIEGIKKLGINLSKTLFISKKAHLILPSHRILDAASEAAKGKSKIGSTLKGIGPTYMDKTGRNGLRVGDIKLNFKEKYDSLVDKHRLMLDKLYEFDYDISEYETEWFEGIKVLAEFQLIDSEQFLNDALKDGKSILAEGAQGTMLDVDFGSYPFVTSSNTVCAGACTGLGIAPNRIGRVIGIFKAYCTRVGMGPFPTELFDADGDLLRAKGNEFGSTTGRARRCGWLDLVALKYSIMINGVTELTMMKSDVMDDFDTIKICTSYLVNGEEVEHVPYEMTDDIKPVYTEFKGWKTDMTAVTHENEFPEEFNAYINFIEEETGVPVKIVSVGPNRAQTIERMLD
ncbi:adenylosuccinate synthase [Labilibaculum sp. A4]|uniref:Adenylosuccinate synthetase n=1 Tax=Labilibaculum euxinus TaxID=2686357 RepID=A0A425YE32_9BACT|nr:adenylosuccinate synthase [Labilibaculum euxinus]MDQ1770921.1 adenylosuccinate synthase [Labilibaculum euxinus]MUP37449.1 adenylosuccinate synthase [Labilibaculum euxinus]MVB06654.1 adenylosuccinate synthase [Labilibaculum euxinus]MWN76091.1 adenylosuccinate synthase [Labilibaculum euxinus]